MLGTAAVPFRWAYGSCTDAGSWGDCTGGKAEGVGTEGIAAADEALAGGRAAGSGSGALSA